MIIMYSVILAVIFEILPEMNEGLELVPFPTEEFKQKIAYSLAIDFIVCYGIEKLMKNLYLKQFRSQDAAAQMR